MRRYMLRRILYMVPTVFGVILVTFLLFNVVGGSPAAMTLGKNVSPKALEEFDEQRGFNKPVLLGNWARTRAFPDSGFQRNAGPWRSAGGARWLESAAGDPARVALPAGGAYPAPLAFRLRESDSYRWVVTYRLAGARAAQFAASTNAEAARIPIPPSAGWRTARLDCAAGRAPPVFVVGPGGGDLEIRSMSLRRKTRSLFDSQLVFYLRQLARLDFGVSNSTNQRVSRMLRDGVLPSLSLTVPIFFGDLAASIAIALLCAFFRNTFIDRLFVVIAVALMSVNYLVWIVGGQYLFAYRLGWFPIWGFASWRYLLLPVLIGVASGLGSGIRFYRTIMLDEIYRDYVRTAMAKGVGRGGILFRHVLKNAMIPVITNVILAIPFLYTGSLLLESFFGIPGLGYLGVQAINSSDVDVVRAVVFIGAILYVVFNLATDICYALADPRVKLR